jgi:hypothetical protein
VSRWHSLDAVAWGIGWHNRRVRLIVFVDSWQLEEDGAILQVGQEVEWWLAFHDASWWPQEPDEHMQHLSAFGRRIDWEGTERVRFPTELTADGAILYRDAPEQIDGQVELVGSIHRDVGVDTPGGLPVHPWSDPSAPYRDMEVSTHHTWLGAHREHGNL